MIPLLAILLVVLLWSTTECLIASRHREKLSGFGLRAEFFEKFDVENWATFDKLSLNLTAKPIFIALTGETGSGKSVLVKALEFCAGRKKSKPLHPFLVGPEQRDIRIDLSTRNNQLEMGRRLFTRTVSTALKRSYVEIDGRKASAKDMQAEISERIRFWPDEEHSAGKYLRYVDRLVCRRDANVHNALSTAYIKWKETKSDLDKLKRIKTKMEDGNEFELISFYKEEYDSHFQKLQNLLVDVQRLFSELLDSSLFATSENESTELTQLIQIIDRLAPKKNLKKLSTLSSTYLQDAKVALDSVENVLRSLFAIVMAPVGSSGGSRLQKIMRDLESYNKDLQNVQESFSSPGILGNGFQESISGILEHISAAGDHMREGHRGMTALEALLPVVTEVLDRMKKLTLEWDLLAKKHQVGRSDLQELRETWEEELTAMASIASTFPIALETEKGAYQKYQDIAQKLTSLRSLAAKDLVIFLNEILADLNMPENAVLLVETQRKSPSATGSNDFVMVSTATGSPVEKVFSSGEMARLALAMEGSLAVSANESSDISGSIEQCLLICDEIDAHVGGEASNAAARLLKRIGRTKQVIAITHNPLIAAAADMHLVVDKVDEGVGSIVAEVNGETRVSELARMATGKLEMTAGSDLARALLTVNYEKEALSYGSDQSGATVISIEHCKS